MASQNLEVLRRLKSNHYLDNIGLLFKSLYSNDNLADVTISCRDGPTIEAHKIVLSACSSYFHELLSKKTSHPVFIMHKISYQDMLYLLEFMYKGVIDVPADNVDHLIKIAKELEITDFCLPDNTQQIIPQTSHNAKKRKSNHIDSLPAVVFDQGKPNETVTIPEIDVVSLSDSPSTIRKSISDRSISDVNENQTSALSRNTRFKGKKRVPVCETIDVIDNIDISPRSLLKKKANNSLTKIKDSHPVQHSTPNSKDHGLSDFIIKDVSGGNGSIILNYKNGKDTSKLSTKGLNSATTSSPLPVLSKSESSSNFTVTVSPDDLSVDIDTVTPDIEIENENNPISLDDSITDIDTPEIDIKDEDPNKAKPRKLKCEICKKKFYLEKHLQKHKKTHHAGSDKMRVLFPCKKCDEKFSRFDKLKQHIKTYHDDDDYVPKGEKKKRLYGNPIEASPTELKDIEHSNNPTSVTQSIIQSIKNITYTPKKENGENDTSNGNNTSQNSEVSSGKRGRGRPPKEKPLIVKPRRPKGRPRIYSELLGKQKERKPVGRPRKSDTPRKTKILGRKPGRPRKSEQSFFDENQSRSNVSGRSGDNYDGASLPYGDLSYLTTGLLNHAGDSSSSTNIYENQLPEPLQTDPLHTSISTSSSNKSLAQRSMTPVDTKTEIPPILTPNKNLMTFIPPIKSETNTTITQVPPTLEPIIPFQNENITITQIPPLLYLKPSVLNTPSTSSTLEQSDAINMKKIGDCTIRPLT